MSKGFADNNSDSLKTKKLISSNQSQSRLISWQKSGSATLCSIRL